jgi:hypothetical protein
MSVMNVCIFLLATGVPFFLFAWIITPSKENGVDHEVNKLYSLLLGPPKKRVSYGVAADAVMSLETLPICIKQYMDGEGVDSFTSKSGRFVWLEATEYHDILHIDEKTALVHNRKHFETKAMVEEYRIKKLHDAYDEYKGLLPPKIPQVIQKPSKELNALWKKWEAEEKKKRKF